MAMYYRGYAKYADIVRCDIIACIQKFVGSLYNTIHAYNQLKAFTLPIAPPCMYR